MTASRFDTLYLISGLASGSLSMSLVAAASAAPYASQAKTGTMIRSLVPSFGLLSGLLCVASHALCRPGSSSLATRKQLYLTQLASTCVCLLLIVAGPIVFVASVENKWHSILIDEIGLGAILAASLAASALLGWLDGGGQLILACCNSQGSGRSGDLQPKAHSDGSELPLSLKQEGYRISAANKKRRPPTSAVKATAVPATDAAASGEAASNAPEQSQQGGEAAKPVEEAGLEVINEGKEQAAEVADSVL